MNPSERLATLMQNMYPHLASVLLETIRRAGFHVGTAGFMRLDSGQYAAHVDATSSATGERWTVWAASEYEAAVELAVQIGFDLEE